MTNDGTVTTRPVSSVAGLTCAAAVAPLMPGTVSVTFRSTVSGRWMPDRLVLVELDVDERLRQQVERAVAEHLLRQVNLLVGLGVHEVEQVAVPVEELHLVLVERRALHVVFRPELVVDEPVGPDVAQLALDVPALVAGRDVVQLEDAAQARRPS